MPWIPGPLGRLTVWATLLFKYIYLNAITNSVKCSSVSDQAKYIIYVLWLLLWFPLSYHLIHLQQNVFRRLKAYRAVQSAWESFLLESGHQQSLP